jgi:hypothetical protein
VDNSVAPATENGSAQSWLIATHKRYDSGSPLAIKNDIAAGQQLVTRAGVPVRRAAISTRIVLDNPMKPDPAPLDARRAICAAPWIEIQADLCLPPMKSGMNLTRAASSKSCA